MSSPTDSRIKQAIGFAPWAGPGDRFMQVGYRDPLPLAEQLQRITNLGDLVEGIELGYLNEETLPQIRRFLRMII